MWLKKLFCSCRSLTVIYIKVTVLRCFAAPSYPLHASRESPLLHLWDFHGDASQTGENTTPSRNRPFMLDSQPEQKDASESEENGTIKGTEDISCPNRLHSKHRDDKWCCFSVCLFPCWSLWNLHEGFLFLHTSSLLISFPLIKAWTDTCKGFMRPF